MRITMICVELLLLMALIASRTAFTRLVADPPFERWLGIGGPPLAAVVIIVIGPLQLRDIIFLVVVGSIVLWDVVRIRRLRRKSSSLESTGARERGDER